MHGESGNCPFMISDFFPIFSFYISRSSLVFRELACKLHPHHFVLLLLFLCPLLTSSSPVAIPLLFLLLATSFPPCPPTPQGKGPLLLQWGGRCCQKLFLQWLLSAPADKQGLWSADPQPEAPLLCSKAGWLAARGCPGTHKFLCLLLPISL